MIVITKENQYTHNNSPAFKYLFTDTNILFKDLYFDLSKNSYPALQLFAKYSNINPNQPKINLVTDILNNIIFE